jgi:hypothetical protein
VDDNGAICPKETNDLVTVSFSTAGIPEADRMAMWRDHHASVALNAEIAPAYNHPFEACVVSHIVPGLHLLSVTLSPARIMRTRDRVADGNDEFALFVNRTGHATVYARGREVTLAPGDGVLISSDDVMVCDRSSHGESLSLRVPRSVLSSTVIGIDDAVMRPISAQSETLWLLTSYAARKQEQNSNRRIERDGEGVLHCAISRGLNHRRLGILFQSVGFPPYRGTPFLWATIMSKTT